MKAGALFSWLKFLELFLDEFPTSQGSDFPLKSFLGLHDELLCEAQATKVFFLRWNQISVAPGTKPPVYFIAVAG